jgi:hypothetical protein
MKCILNPKPLINCVSSPAPTCDVAMTCIRPFQMISMIINAETQNEFFVECLGLTLVTTLNEDTDDTVVSQSHCYEDSI